jgi:phage gp36-like protein
VGLITQAELETAISTARLQRISDKTNSAIDAALVAFAIEEASSTVLKYAQGTPGYPWTVTPTQAKTVCVEITVYYIYKELWGFVPADVRRGYEDSIAQLDNLAKGKTSWVEGQTPAAASTGTIFYTNSIDRPREGAPVRARRWSTKFL